MIVFILNTILFQSIKITQGQQFKQPTKLPGEGAGASIVTSPLSADLDLGGNNIFGDGSICDSNGCIGDSTFGGDLNVMGGINVTGDITDTSVKMRVEATYPDSGYGYAGYSLKNSLGTYWNMQIATNGQDLEFRDENNQRTPLTIGYDGNVGIGINNPEAKLDVRGNIILGGVNSVNVIAATNPRCNEDADDPSGCSSMIGTGLVKGSPAWDDNSIGGFHPDGAFWADPMVYRSIRAPNDGSGEFPWNNYGELFIQGTSYGSSYNRGISLATWDGTDNDPAIRMRVDGDGNVGLGTNTPNRTLHIKTNSNDEFINAEIGIQSGDNDYWAIYHDNDTEDLRFWHEGDRLTITDDGSVGIGVTEPWGKLDVRGNTVLGGGNSVNAILASYVRKEGIDGPMVGTGFVRGRGIGEDHYDFDSLDPTPGDFHENGAFWAAPIIYRSTRYPDGGGGDFPYNEYGELLIQGTSYGAGYNRGISFITWDGTDNDPNIRVRVDGEGNLEARGNTVLGGGNSVNVITASHIRLADNGDMVGNGLVRGLNVGENHSDYDSSNSTNGFHNNGAFWASPMIYRSTRYPDGGGGDFPYNNYGELLIQGTSYGAGYNRGISLATWDGTDNDPAIRMRVNGDGDVRIEEDLRVVGDANLTDVNLSNENREKPNEIDGTRGSWTIQEGDENLFLINRNTGQKYEFVLKERN